ncbi:hypothetical protein ACFLIM_34345 [Nonomuraea sp. M3C6]|uniref:Uncharacterized protein n=1 Tax=Nonomuraea marmarensis TaxID=3351344 RepID=A0ABW7AMQ2_9ACTN
MKAQVRSQILARALIILTDLSPFGRERPPRQHILEGMKPASGAPRRHLPTSPFKPPPPAPPAKRFSVDDQVTHDRYGLGVVIGVEDEVAVLVDFGSRQERITTPFNKLYKL